MPIRDTVEIQRAHDILWSQHMGETPFVLSDDARPFVHAALDVLCWVLRHEHSDGFTKSLADIEHGLAAGGFAFRDMGAPAQQSPRLRSLIRQESETLHAIHNATDAVEAERLRQELAVVQVAIMNATEPKGDDDAQKR